MQFLLICSDFIHIYVFLIAHFEVMHLAHRIVK